MKLASAIALIAIPSILLTACNGGGNATPTLAQPGIQSVGAQNPASATVKSAAITPFDTSSNDLHGGGATFPAEAYNGASQPVGSYTDNQALPASNSLFATSNYGGTANVYYCLTGSGFGKAVFDGADATLTTQPCAALGQSPTGFGGRVDPPDFAGSDQALLTTDYNTYLADREGGVAGGGRGEPFEFPSLGGPIVYPYNAADYPGITKNATTGQLNPVKMSRWTWCAIANGTITDWSDPALTKDNGGHSLTKGASEPLYFVYRSDGSGTSYNYQNTLQAVCGSTWSAPYNAAPYESTGRTALWGRGTSKNWVGPTTGNFVGESGNPGVVAEIQAQPGATGYAEGAYIPPTTNPTLSEAKLQNSAGNFELPTSSTAVSAALSTVAATMGGAPDGTLATSRPECIFYVDPSQFDNPSASGAYPIVGVTYLMGYSKGNGTHFTNLKKLFNYIESTTAASLIHSLQYTQLPSSIKTNVHSAINGTNGYTGNACLNL